MPGHPSLASFVPPYWVSASRAHALLAVYCFIWQLLLLVDFMGAPNECANSIAVELQFKWRSAVDSSSRGRGIGRASDFDRQKGKGEGRQERRQLLCYFGHLKLFEFRGRNDKLRVPRRISSVFGQMI